MNLNVIAIVLVLFFSLAIQFFLVVGFVQRLRKWKVRLIGDEAAPSSVVILCLRGGDPFLEKCIEGLITQDYPNYQVCFLVDHKNDPAVPILNATLQRHKFKKFEIKVLREPLKTCSLKCSSLVQAIEGLEPSVRFIALLDADTVPHPTWLRELATALVPEDVGAATGNRWYMPEQYSPGALTRYLWNAAAVVQMYWYGIAWGGTVAIKTDAIRRAGLLDRWRHSLCEDTMLRKQLSSIGQRIQFVPSLMMVNREDCTLESFASWVRRQLLTAKLYHPLWIAVVAHGISTAAILIWAWATVVTLLINGDWIPALWIAVSLTLYRTCLILMAPWMESAVANIVNCRGEPTDWHEQIQWSQMVWCASLTQWVYTWALLKCMVTRDVEWRGIQYRAQGPWQIQMLGYQPYTDGSIGDASTQSL